MKKLLIATSLLIFNPFSALQTFAETPDPTPWLTKQLAKQRVKCPSGKSPFLGREDAAVTIVEFVDYECPFCAQEEATMKQVVAAYPTQVKLVIKNLPLEIHPKAKQKAIVAECMGMQGKFWQAHNEFLAGAPPSKVRAGVDAEKLKAAIAQGGDGQVDRDIALAKRLGLATTPSFIIDGIRQGGTIGLKQFKLLVDAELARKSSKESTQ